jgi:hypothetical protein
MYGKGAHSATAVIVFAVKSDILTQSVVDLEEDLPG